MLRRSSRSSSISTRSPNSSKLLSSALLLLLPAGKLKFPMRGKSPRVGRAHRPLGTVAFEAVLLTLTTPANTALENQIKCNIAMFKI